MRLWYHRISSVMGGAASPMRDRKSTRLNSSHRRISYAVFCLKKHRGHANGGAVSGGGLQQFTSALRRVTIGTSRHVPHSARDERGSYDLALRLFFFSDGRPPDVPVFPRLRLLPN